MIEFVKYKKIVESLEDIIKELEKMEEADRDAYYRRAH